MQVSVMFCVTFILIVFVSTSFQVDIYLFRNSKCFKKYLQQINSINRNYEESFKACNDSNNFNRQPPQHLDLEAEIDNYKQTAREACLNLTACNSITDLIEFFDCHSKQAEQNLKSYLIIHLNASSVTIELNHQYDQKEKEILRCQLAVKREYFLESAAAFKQHLSCLNGC